MSGVGSAPSSTPFTRTCAVGRRRGGSSAWRPLIDQRLHAERRIAGDGDVRLRTRADAGRARLKRKLLIVELQDGHGGAKRGRTTARTRTDGSRAGSAWDPVRAETTRRPEGLASAARAPRRLRRFPCLQAVEPLVQSAPRAQRGVRPPLAHLAVVQHEDLARRRRWC